VLTDVIDTAQIPWRDLLALMRNTGNPLQISRLEFGCGRPILDRSQGHSGCLAASEQSVAPSTPATDGLRWGQPGSTAPTCPDCQQIRAFRGPSRRSAPFIDRGPSNARDHPACWVVFVVTRPKAPELSATRSQYQQSLLDGFA
jgi:hypothetical protein